ncbi:MAG TPA: PQQ-binding-like beta-propeller repeat protein [Thermoguttaceae bacterium]|nr:PQQ-binding-like beta-propeller repeat protein [Thermoguttaceae bacterium]
MMPLPSEPYSLAPFAVILVVAPILPVIAAVLLGVLVAVGGVLVSMFRPRAILGGIKLLWRLKLSVALVAVVGAGGVWAALALWPQKPTEPVEQAETGSDWPLFRGGLARTGAVPWTAQPNRPAIHWIFRDGSVGFYSSPAVVGNRVYVASETPPVFKGVGSGEIYCFDADTGQVAWHKAPKGYQATFSSPSVRGDYLVCGEGLHDTENARVICMDLRPGHEGEILWTYQTDSHVECSPVIHNGRVYIGAGDDGYYCFDLQPGADGQAQLVWHAPGEEFPDAETSLAAAGENVYAGLGVGGKAICVLDAKTGQLKHRIETEYPVFGPPAIVDGKLYIAMGNGDYINKAEEQTPPTRPAGAVWCVDLATFEVDWRFTQIGRTVLGAVAVEGDELYFGSRDGFLYCLGKDGKLIDKYDTHSPLITSPAVTRDYVYVVTDSGWLYCLDRRTMELAWEMKIAAQPLLVSSPAVARGRVYVGTQNDGFLCVGQAAEENRAALWPCRLGGPERGGNADDSPLPKVGALHWQFPKDQEGTDKARVVAPAAVMGDSLFVPLAGGGKPSGVACLPAHADSQATPEPRWIYETANDVHLSPAVLDDTLIVVDGQGDAEPPQTDRFLHGLDVATGEPRWRFPVAEGASGVFLCTDEEIYVQDQPEAISCVYRLGLKAWSRPLGRLERPPAATDSMLVAAVVDPPGLVAMDRPSGRRLWHVRLDATPRTPPVVIRSTIYLGTAAGLEARSLANAAPREEWKLDGGGVSSDFIVARRFFAYVSDKEELVLVSRDDGSVIRTQPDAMPGTAPLLSRGKLIYIGKEAIMAFEPDEGDAEPIRWVEYLLGEPSAPMILCNSNVYVGMFGWGLVRFGAGR